MVAFQSTDSEDVLASLMRGQAHDQQPASKRSGEARNFAPGSSIELDHLDYSEANRDPHNAYESNPRPTRRSSSNEIADHEFKDEAENSPGPSQLRYPPDDRDRSTHPLATPKGHGLHIHPLSTILIIIWMLYIIFMVYLYERAAKIGRGDDQVQYIDLFNYTVVASFLGTVFAQAHAPITAFHLSRLALSALHRPLTAPRTWRELFWSADRAWKGPIGILSTLIQAARARVFVSWTFLLFVLTSVCALLSPFLLAQAYASSEAFAYEWVRRPSNLQDAVQAMAADNNRFPTPSYIDQHRLGDALWSSGVPLDSVYRSSVYHSSEAAGPSHEHDFFFSAALQPGINAFQLPGVKYIGGCTATTDDAEVSAEDSLRHFKASCEEKGLELSPLASSESLLNSSTTIIKDRFTEINTNFTFCGRTSDPWSNIFDASSSVVDDSASALAWVSQHKVHRDAYNDTLPVGTITPQIQGIIECNSTFSLGRASLRSMDMIFFDFQLINDWDWSLSMADYAHPLLAAMDTLSLSPEWYTDTDGTTGRITSKMWFQEMEARLLTEGVWETYPYDLSLFADIIWRGSTYMAIPIAVLYTEPVLHGPAEFVREIPITVLTRKTGFFAAAMAALAIWAFLVLFLTATMLRPTFASELGSYTAARLLVEHGQLVEGYGSGDIHQNPNMNRRFGRVGDDDEDRVVGRIAVGGDGMMPLAKGDRKSVV